MPTLTSKQKCLAIHLAGLAAAIAVIAAVYHLTRPPELVWWRSPLVHSTGRRVCVLQPLGWKLRDSYSDGETMTHYNLGPDQRSLPKWLEWLGSANESDANI